MTPLVPRIVRVTAAVLALIALFAGCASGAASPSPSPSIPAATVDTPEAAAARVVVVNPSLDGIGPRDPDLIGGCCFWEATPTDSGFEVVFEVGWGDCPAGCIDRHRWTYAVSRDGGVTLVSETGSAVPSGVPGGGGGSGGSTGGGILPGGTGIEGHVLAGPTCPVVTVDDPSCADRPVPGATIVVLDANGNEVARLITDASGAFAVALPPGPYTIEPQRVEGFMGVAESMPVTVGNGVATVDVQMDTGIR
jgi:hypothetical protein